MNYKLFKTEEDYQDWLKNIDELKAFVIAEKDTIYGIMQAQATLSTLRQFSSPKILAVRLENAILHSKPVGVGVKLKKQVLREVPLQSGVLQQYQTKYKLKEAQEERKDYSYATNWTQKKPQLIFPKGTLGIFSRWTQAGTTYISTISTLNPVTGKIGLTVDILTSDLDWDLTSEEKESLAQAQVSRVMRRDNKKCTLEKLAYLGQLHNSGGQPQPIELQTGSQAPLP